VPGCGGNPNPAGTPSQIRKVAVASIVGWIIEQYDFLVTACYLLDHVGIQRAYLYVGALVMAYAVAAILAIVATSETKGRDLEDVAVAPETRRRGARAA
jgi:hypothetical protein